MEPLTSTFNLVQRAKSGDRAAMDTLMDRYYPRLQRIVRVRIGARLRRQIETSDILADAFRKAIDIFDRFEMRDEGSLLRWLGQIAERQIHDAADHFDAKKRDPARERPLAAHDSHRAAAEPPDSTALRPEAVADLHEAQLRIEVALDRLPVHYREVILARDFEGLQWDDVAKATGRPSADAARMLYSKAIAELTVLLQQGNNGASAESS